MSVHRSYKSGLLNFTLNILKSLIIDRIKLILLTRRLNDDTKESLYNIEMIR